jgi:hypothetical protein
MTTPYPAHQAGVRLLEPAVMTHTAAPRLAVVLLVALLAAAAPAAARPDRDTVARASTTAGQITHGPYPPRCISCIKI